MNLNANQVSLLLWCPSVSSASLNSSRPSRWEQVQVRVCDLEPLAGQRCPSYPRLPERTGSWGHGGCPSSVPEGPGASCDVSLLGVEARLPPGAGVWRKSARAQRDPHCWPQRLSWGESHGSRYSSPGRRGQSLPMSPPTVALRRKGGLSSGRCPRARGQGCHL